jgi:DNA topoisomerase-3
LTKAVATALLKDGRVKMKGLYSEKTGKTYDATVVLDDTRGEYVGFKLEFEKKGRRNG